MRPKHDKERFQQSNYYANLVNLSKTQMNYTKMFLTTQGVKPLKQFNIIISKSQVKKHENTKRTQFY